LYRIYTDTALRFLLAIFYGLGSIIIMFSYSWQLAIIVILLGVSETMIIAKVATKIEKGTSIIQELTSKQTQLFLEIIKSLNFFKMMSLSHYIKKKYSYMNEDIVNQSNNVNRINILLELINSVFEALNLIVVLGIGIVFYLNHSIDLGSVMSFLILQDGISYMIDNMKNFFKSINWQMVSFNRTFELLNIPEEEEQLSDTKKEIPMGDIKFEHVSFQYKDSEDITLNDVNFVIPKGKITVIQGASGSGKSTILKLLLGFYQPKQGSIKIGNLDYKDIDLSSIRENISYVAQSVYFFHETVENNIKCDNKNISINDVVDIAKYVGLDDALKKKEEGYQTVIDDIGNNFSGGERQKIAFARVILKNSDIVILDEATSALDVENEELVYKYINQLANMGKSVIIVSHRQMALQFVYQTIQIDQGKIL
jgi:ATP-binding cassette subfamily B protein